MILRRALALSLMLLCWHNLPAQEIHAAPKDCPPSDGYAWVKFPGAASGKVLWAQTRTQQQFTHLCGYASACALRFQEITILVSQSPEWTVSESLKHHEECHDSHDHQRGTPVASLLR